jgi:hypothetical protein
MALSAAAFAQKQQAPGTQLTVSKTATAEYPAMHTTIQSAVNAAQAGWVIEILDESVYNEQVTIDGRETSPWPGVTGGKNGITIRYVPPAGTPINSGFKRPTIRYKDTTNVSPKTSQQAQTDGELPGNGGNFETCGALRIIRAEGVTIEGIAIDGGGAYPFGYTGVWCPPQGGNCSALTHGNAAITLVVAGGAVIRNCDIRNAFNGVNIKDRNTGGVFGNPNPADNDNTIPLSGFGKVGNHLIEQNRIHNNSVGIFCESAWDLSNTVRFNLIYNNYHSSSLKTTEQGGIEGIPDGGNMIAAAIMFKDMVYTPMAIYNNTFYRNANNLVAHWKVGATHLLFNNIFSEPYTLEAHYMNIDHRFPNRMYNSVLAAQSGQNGLGVQCQENYNCDNGRAPGGCFFRDVTITNSFGKAALDTVNLRTCNNGVFDRTQPQTLAVPGALLRGGQQMAYPIPSAANVRWLEMTKRTTTPPAAGLTYDLFESTDTANAKFLWPKWDDTLVIRLIKNKGWTGANIRNADGLTADIGAISSAGSGSNKPLATIARIKPTNVVMVNGTTATASFYLNVDAGTLTNPTIKFLRWVAPLPNACKDADPSQCNWAGDAGGQSAIELPASAIRDLTPPGTVLNVGTNSLTFTLPSALTSATKYGFFEIVVEGTDAGGNTVRSDVGFLPYRELTHRLEVCVQVGTGWNCGTGTNPPSVNAGEAVKLRVTAQKRENNGSWTAYNDAGPALRAQYRLLSHSTARMWQEITAAGIPRRALDSTANLLTGSTRTQEYTVYFTRAGDEVISAAGQHGTLPLLGELRLKVNAGTPDMVVFLNPIPKSQLSGNPPLPPTISGTYDVEVQVQDMFGNAVTSAVPVSMVSDKPNIGRVDKASAATDPADGIARFVAEVGPDGVVGNIFDLTASISVAGASQPSDVGSLRVGRVMDALRVFYHESGKNGSDGGAGANKGGYWGEDYYAKEDISARVGSWQPVWVKVVNNSGDTVVTSKSGYVCVTAGNPGIQFSATDGGAGSAGPFSVAVTGGVASFWITSLVQVEGVSLNAVAKSGSGCDVSVPNDNTVGLGTRGEIAFTKPDGDVGMAFVKGDGYARPNYVEITFKGDGAGGFNTTPETWRKPDSVTLRWPDTCGGAPVASASGAAIAYLPDGVTIGVTFPPGAFPEGYSNVISPSTASSLVTIYGAIEAGNRNNPEGLTDSIGPLIARVRANPYCGAAQFINPTFDENKNSGVTPDVLRLQLTEPLPEGGEQLLKGESILMSSDSTGTDEIRLTVLGVERNGNVYELTISPETPLINDYWIKLDAAAGITDRVGNTVAADNRRVRISEQETPAGISSAWYTAADSTGKADSVNITFDKPLTGADIADWFVGGSFSFAWDGGGVGNYSVTEDNVGSIRYSGQNTISINLGTALSQGEFDKMTGGKIRTGGTVTVGVTFSPNKTGWDLITVAAEDKARPVLISAVLQRGSVNDDGVDNPDTLILTFSEAPGNGITTIANPVKIKVGGVWTDVTLQIPIPQPPPVSSGSPHYMARYVVTAGGINDGVKVGDSVMINVGAGVTDAVMPTPNVQDRPDNRRVALEIKLGKPNWKTTVKNNPFRDSVGIETTPRSNNPDLTVVGSIKLYDNMGKLVWEEEKRNVRGDIVEWVWKGRNKNGRTVGTGTYLFNARYTAYLGNEVIDRYTEKKAIGFVRR